MKKSKTIEIFSNVFTNPQILQILHSAEEFKIAAV
jgi:ribonuclease D